MGDNLAFSELSADFAEIVANAGLSDMATDIGLPAPRAPRSPPLGGTAGGASSSADNGSLPAAGPWSGANGDGMSSPAPVHLPGMGAGPTPPATLAPEHQGMLSGEPAAKKKRMQRAHGGKQQAGDKGLRHFSMKVCEKVEQKVRTTYNEVADELVAEFVSNPQSVSELSQSDLQYDEKNIRRRVYDALNVLMAMDIITKEKKNIMWRGLPTNTEQEGARLQMDVSTRKDRIEKKAQHLQELISQQISFTHLVSRNQPANGGAAERASEEQRLALPFIIVNTRKETVIDCEMAEDRQEIFFNFSEPFEIHDDTEILKRMNMHQCPRDQLSAVVPESLVGFTAHYMQEESDRPYVPPGIESAALNQPPTPVKAQPAQLPHTPGQPTPVADARPVAAVAAVAAAAPLG